MQNIPFTYALPGMVLAREIKNPDNPDGPPVCGKGVSLTEALIERLRQKGVQSVTVEGRPVKMDGDKPVEEMLAELDKRFRKVADDPQMNLVKEIYKRQTIRSMKG